ncbi:Cylicin-2, partial [Ophiophagus hannah]
MVAGIGNSSTSRTPSKGCTHTHPAHPSRTFTFVIRSCVGRFRLSGGDARNLENIQSDVGPPLGGSKKPLQLPPPQAKRNANCFLICKRIPKKKAQRKVHLNGTDRASHLQPEAAEGRDRRAGGGGPQKKEGKKERNKGERNKGERREERQKEGRKGRKEGRRREGSKGGRQAGKERKKERKKKKNKGEGREGGREERKKEGEGKRRKEGKELKREGREGGREGGKERKKGEGRKGGREERRKGKGKGREERKEGGREERKKEGEGEGKEGKREGSEGGREAGKEGRKERKEKEGRRERREGGKKEGEGEGRKEGRKERKRKGKEGRKEGKRDGSQGGREGNSGSWRPGFKEALARRSWVLSFQPPPQMETPAAHLHHPHPHPHPCNLFLNQSYTPPTSHYLRDHLGAALPESMGGWGDSVGGRSPPLLDALIGKKKKFLSNCRSSTAAFCSSPPPTSCTIPPSPHTCKRGQCSPQRRGSQLSRRGRQASLQAGRLLQETRAFIPAKKKAQQRRFGSLKGPAGWGGGPEGVGVVGRGGSKTGARTEEGPELSTKVAPVEGIQNPALHWSALL